MKLTKLLNLFKKKKTIEERIKDIQQGDENDREALIQEYIPFITKILTKQLGRYIEKENDDIFSIGLMAFNEAIDKYDEVRGKFLTFASVVIRNRAIDELRRKDRISEKNMMMQLPIEGTGEGQEEVIAVESFEEQMELKIDMITLVKRMKEFGVSLDQLIQEAPKHRNTRATAIKIGRYFHRNEELKEKFLTRQRLPMKKIMEDLHISNRIIQRNREFIMAVVLILDSNLDTLKDYLVTGERGENDGI